jgi:hypothetical protein
MKMQRLYKKGGMARQVSLVEKSKNQNVAVYVSAFLK